MTVYFDRTQPMYLTDSASFDGVPVDVDANALQIVGELRLLIETTEDNILEAASPERSNQELAEKFVAGLMEIVNGYK